LLVAVALVTAVFSHLSLSKELANWDGRWYLEMAQHQFPRHVTVHFSTLGFLPAYGMLIWLVAHVFFCSYVVAGVLISLIGGLAAVVLVQRLTSEWWGRATGQRAAILFCLFPGSVVFSIVYPESVLLPLAVGCLLALRRRRWVLAGLLAGLATAVEADALVLVPVCIVASALEISNKGWSDPSARRSVAAPLLAPLGAVGAGVFLWVWAGTPFATYDAQRIAWHESTTPLARIDELRRLIAQIPQHFQGARHRINLNHLSDLIGTVYLLVASAIMLRKRFRPPVEVVVWALGIGLLTLLSTGVAPNPRLLLTAFPLVVVMAKVLKTRGYVVLATTWTALLVVMSSLSFVPISLRP
jgi:hypothetical protein